MTSRADPSGLTSTYVYDSANRLVSLSAAPTAGGSNVDSFGVSYDDFGEETALTQTYPTVSGVANNSGGWAFAYAAGGEMLTSTFTPSGGSAQPTVTYTYDGSGNRASTQIGSGTPVTTSYDGADRISAVGSTSYIWNDQNELTNVGTATNYSYDPWGRVTSATAGGSTAGYAYDALDRTMSETVGSIVTSFIYDGITQNVATQTIGTGTPTDYTQTSMGVLGSENALNKRYFELDPHGDVGVIMNASAAAKGTISYDPWGTPTPVGEGTSSLLGFQSQPHDPVTGLTDMGARLYDPAQGRFTIQDSTAGSAEDPLSENAYIYADDSPELGTDPNGQLTCLGGYDCTATILPPGSPGAKGHNAWAEQTAAAEDASYSRISEPAPTPKVAPASPLKLQSILQRIVGIGVSVPVRSGELSIPGAEVSYSAIITAYLGGSAFRFTQLADGTLRADVLASDYALTGDSNNEFNARVQQSVRKTYGQGVTVSSAVSVGTAPGASTIAIQQSVTQTNGSSFSMSARVTVRARGGGLPFSVVTPISLAAGGLAAGWGVVRSSSITVEQDSVALGEACIQTSCWEWLAAGG